ncbi:MAG: 16S rRNA (guanine(966)-N(2))-methyltransferase RsmD [Chloroflexi bacterium]|nr:16S rRNA (guanine(966)-N(2))-methyltransferase RsmD [Chloroflexota bacterium]
MRVISGIAKGRRLLPVPGDGTRPITDRTKESLFNIIGPDVAGTRFLDLFAGTGSVGIEALSRGAAEVLFVDRAHKAVSTIRRNLEATGLTEGARVVQMDSFRFLEQAAPATRFEYIYVAPPQYLELWARALVALNEKPLLSEDGQVIVQIHPKEWHAVEAPNLALVDERRYGSTSLYFFGLSAAGLDLQARTAP